MGLGKLRRDCAGPTSHIFKDLNISLLVLQHRISYEVFGPTVSEFANINRLQGTGQKLQELIRESQVETTQSIFNRFPASKSPNPNPPTRRPAYMRSMRVVRTHQTVPPQLCSLQPRSSLAGCALQPAALQPCSCSLRLLQPGSAALADGLEIRTTRATPISRAANRANYA